MKKRTFHEIVELARNTPQGEPVRLTWQEVHTFKQALVGRKFMFKPMVLGHPIIITPPVTERVASVTGIVVRYD